MLIIDTQMMWVMDSQDERDRVIILVDKYYTDISCILKTIKRRVILEN